MFKRASAGFVLGCSALLLSGCGTRTEPGEGAAPDRTVAAKPPAKEPEKAAVPEKSTAPAAAQQVTVHVPDMAKRLGLTWLTWPNKVQEALSGLPGVESVKADLDNDQLEVRYYPQKIAPAALLEAVGKQGFQAKIVVGAAPPPWPWQEYPAMHPLFRSVLAFLTLGMVSIGCGKSDKSDPLAAPTDVTLKVPGMNWPVGWPDRVRAALGTLPWVEHDSVQTDIPKREVRFNLKDRKAFNEEDVKNALKGKGFPEVTVQAAPSPWCTVRLFRREPSGERGGRARLPARG
jgi:copper chaperone CopZ